MLTDLRKLSPVEQLRLEEAVWEHIERRAQTSPVPEWQRALIRRRYLEYVHDPQAGVYSNGVKASFRSRRSG